MRHKLLASEIVLEDDYPIYYNYVYIADMKFVRSEIQGTVKDLKIALNAKEIRRCELFARENAKIGDELEI